jgi:hypothetical protein
MKRSILASALLLLVSATGARAQTGQSQWDRFMPHLHYWQPLIADVQEPRMSLSLMQTNLFKYAPRGRERPAFELPDPEDSRSDVEVGAGIGGSIPFWHLKEWPGHGGIVASAQLGVFARFRIEYRTRTDAGDDWYVGMPFEFAYDRWSGRFRIMHRSSHLGDELIEQTAAQRVEFGGEFADFLLARKFAKDARVYAGGTYNFRSYTSKWIPAFIALGRSDAFAVQAGADGRWFPWSNGHVGFAAGFDWQAQERTNWRAIYGVAAGPAWRVEERGMRLLARVYHGPSSMGEFFLTPETFYSLEWVVDF